MIDKESLHLFCTDAHYIWKSKSPIGLGIVEGTGGHPRVLEVRKGDCALKSQARVLLRIAVEPAHHLVRAVALPSGGSIKIFIKYWSTCKVAPPYSLWSPWTCCGPLLAQPSTHQVHGQLSCEVNIWVICYCWGNSSILEGRFSKWF